MLHNALTGSCFIATCINYYFTLANLTMCSLVIKWKRRDTAAREPGEMEYKQSVDPVRYTAPIHSVQEEPPVAMVTRKPKPKPQRQPTSGNQRYPAKMATKSAPYDTPRALGEAVAGLGQRPVARRGGRPPAAGSSEGDGGIRMSQSIYEAMDPEIYEETF